MRDVSRVVLPILVARFTDRMIPFSLPFIDDDVVNEVVDALTNTGWITSGPKVQEFEKILKEYTTSDAVVAVNSWTSGAMVALRWFGVGPGDEVIVPAYTYAATALAVLNVGATPVLADIGDGFNVSAETVGEALTPKTKAVIPVDVGGMPCDYNGIRQVIDSHRSKFSPINITQENLGRPLVIADAAHSIGACVGGEPVGVLSDLTIMSFHSVKNVTTGEGGAICMNLPRAFELKEEQAAMKRIALNGQTKSALAKSKVGGWRYDIVEQGFKANMTDLCAAVGISQMKRYESRLLPERKEIFAGYSKHLQLHDWAILPDSKTMDRQSSCHLYSLRLDGFDERMRDAVIEKMQEAGIACNVHYMPLPGLTLFQRLGYERDFVPAAFAQYENEISLPLYNGLTIAQRTHVVESLIQSCQRIRT